MSTTIKANELPLVSSLAQLMGITPEGSAGRLKFPNVLEMHKNYSYTDVNDIITPGFYQTSANKLNYPQGVNAPGSLLIVVSHVEGYVTQIVINALWGKKGIFVRGKTLDGWLPWLGIEFTQTF